MAGLNTEQGLRGISLTRENKKVYVHRAAELVDSEYNVYAEFVFMFMNSNKLKVIRLDQLG